MTTFPKVIRHCHSIGILIVHQHFWDQDDAHLLQVEIVYHDVYTVTISLIR